MALSDDDINRMFEQHEEEQTSAGLEHIVKSVAQFRDLCLAHGFSHEEAFQLAREMLVAIIDRVEFVEEEE